MKKLISLLVVMTVCQCLSAQNINRNLSKSFKIYAQYSTENTDTRNSHSRIYTLNSQKVYPSFAFLWCTRKNSYREIEVSNLVFENKEVSTSQNGSKNNVNAELQRINTAQAEIGYKYLKQVFQTKNSKFCVLLGIGANPYFRIYNSVPYTSATFRITETRIGTKANITPKLIYFISKKMYIEANIPYCILDSYYNKTRTENPILSPIEQKKNSAIVDFKPKIFSVNIGIGIFL